MDGDVSSGDDGEDAEYDDDEGSNPESNSPCERNREGLLHFAGIEQYRLKKRFVVT